ncbi:MAG: OmpA family protein [Fibrobacter sp.]|nr:OmpA family protein [Fibrobacter sp.]
MKRILFVLALAISFGQASLNKDGMLGVNRTFSAQTSGHSKFGVGFLADITIDQGMFGTVSRVNPLGNGEDLHPVQLIDSTHITTCEGEQCYNLKGSTIDGVTGAGANFFMSLGLSDYFDLSISLPIYHESYKQTGQWAYMHRSGKYEFVENSPVYGISKTGIGDLRLNAKFRAPMPEDNLIDLALFLGGTISMSSERGLWVRESEYLGTANSNLTTGFGMPEHSWKIGAAATFDFRNIDNGFPLLAHFNFGYRSPLKDYPKIMHIAGAVELFLIDYFSVFGEIYKEMPEGAPANEIDVMEITFGGAIHTGIGLEIYVAAHSFMGNASKFANLMGGQNRERVVLYQGRTMPNLYGMVGLTWHGFLTPQDDYDDDYYYQEPVVLEKVVEHHNTIIERDTVVQVETKVDTVVQVETKVDTLVETKVDTLVHIQTDTLTKIDTLVETKVDTLVQIQTDTLVIRDTLMIEKEAVVIMHGVNFATGSADLTTESFEKLDEVAATLKNSPGVVLEISGHTDDRGSSAINDRLSRERAESVVRYMVSQGVPQEQLSSVGYGSSRPVASNRTAEGREKNRRIEMKRLE